jgi:hypothetical protein
MMDADGSDVPDICVVAQSVYNCTASESLHEWLDHFQSHAKPWPTAAASKTKKRKGVSDKEPPPDEGSQEAVQLQTRCRFVVALNEASVCGLISVPTGGATVKRQIFSFIDEDS